VSNLNADPTQPGGRKIGRMVAVAALLGAAAGLAVLLVALGVVLVVNRAQHRTEDQVNAPLVPAEMQASPGTRAAEPSELPTPTGGEPLERPGEATTAWHPRSARERSLASAIATIADRCPGHMAVTFVHPQYDLRVSFHEDERKPAASVIKLCILMSALRRVASGELSLDGTIGGGTTSLRYLLTWMITESDNTAANALIDALGLETIDREMHDVLHLSPNTTLQRRMLDFDAQKQGRDNYMTTHDIADLLVALKQRGVVPDNMTAFACDLLRGQRRRNKIPQGIPQREGVQVANKTGELPDVENDAAIVYDGDTWWVLVVAVSDCTAPEQARQAIADVARAAWDTLHPQPRVVGQ